MRLIGLTVALALSLILAPLGAEAQRRDVPGSGSWVSTRP
jgi:hypothetical protein